MRVARQESETTMAIKNSKTIPADAETAPICPLETGVEGICQLPDADQHGEIARLAYSYWEERGGQEGSPESDWCRAECELNARRATELNGQNTDTEAS